MLQNAEVVVLDASARELLRAHLARADHVVYCASGLMPADSNFDPVADIGLSLPPLVHTLELLRGRSAVGVTYLSSGGTVYGKPQTEVIREDHSTDPITSYGIMKLTGEKYVLMHHQLYGLPVKILRCANVYGEHQPASRSQGVVAVFLDRIGRGEPVPVYGDGRIVRDFVYVQDLVGLVIKSIAAPSNELIMNVGSGTGFSLREIVSEIEQVLDRRATIDWRPGREFDVQRVVLDIRLARQELGFVPRCLADGLSQTVAAMRKAV